MTTHRSSNKTPLTYTPSTAHDIAHHRSTTETATFFGTLHQNIHAGVSETVAAYLDADKVDLDAVTEHIVAAAFRSFSIMDVTDFLKEVGDDA